MSYCYCFDDPANGQRSPAAAEDLAIGRLVQRVLGGMDIPERVFHV